MSEAGEYCAMWEALGLDLDAHDHSYSTSCLQFAKMFI